MLVGSAPHTTFERIDVFFAILILNIIFGIYEPEIYYFSMYLLFYFDVMFDL